jgi:hypothetical protein
MANWPLGVTHARAGDVGLVLNALVEDVEFEALETTHDADSVVVVLSVNVPVEKLSLVAVAVAVRVSVMVVLSVVLSVENL